MWKSRRDFQGVWEGWKAGFLAFHAFHTLSFPWPACEWSLGLEVTEKAVLHYMHFAAELRSSLGRITSGLPPVIHPPATAGTFTWLGGKPSKGPRGTRPIVRSCGFLLGTT
jgi:hypothetical protein